MGKPASYSQIDATKFFDLLWPKKLGRTERLELRIITRRARRITYRSFEKTLKDFLKQAKARSKEVTEGEIYFGVATRRGRAGKKENCMRVGAVWVDLDDASKIKKARSICKELGIPPQIIVKSGGGYHLYWLLKSKVPVQARMEYIEGINRALVKRLGGDIAAIDVTRILRVPGFPNYKYDPPKKVEAFYWNRKPYKLEDFIEKGLCDLKELPEVSVDLQGGKAVPVGRLKVSPKIRKLLTTTRGSTHNGDPSRQDSAIITSLLSHGLSPADTLATFMATPRGKDVPIRKPGHAEDYLARTIEQALAFLSRKKQKEPVILIDHGDAGVLQYEGSGGKAEIINLGDVARQRTDWMWKGRIPYGKLTLLCGNPGLGKSTITMDLAARVSTGAKYPDGKGRFQKSNVLVICAEDGLADTVRPRIEEAGGDIRRIRSIKKVKFKDEGKVEMLNIYDHLGELYDAVQETQSRLIIIDPLNAYLPSGRIDMNKDQDMRNVLTPLADMAEENGLAIILVGHLNKKQDLDFIFRAQGSVGLVGAVRCGLAVLDDVEDENRRNKIFWNFKNNVAKEAPTWRFRIVGSKDSSKVEWLKVMDFDPNSYQSSYNAGEGAKANKGALLEAKTWLQQALSDGPVEVDQIYKDSRTAQIASRTMRRARTDLEVVPKTMKGKRYWYLPTKKKPSA